ncbi:MAG: PQQ-binding-like beta-propeller repeat protein [Verrucomicrobiales bacterium]|nr:PQQ-binding-like beta-propeller repeat protein [Verrucomicrobiales bacterium]
MKRFLLRLTLLPSLLASTVLGEDAVPPPATPAATPANWPQFRGPNGQGLAPTARIPSRFGPDTNVLWKTPVPTGHSSPVVWNDRLFLTAKDKARPNELVTFAIDTTNGRLLWHQAVESTSPAGFHPLNHPASSTPAVDAERVYVYFGTYGLLAYDHAGTRVWQRRLEPPKSKYGMATSPILHGDTLILAQDGDGNASHLLAVHRATGQTVWEQPRPLFKAGWSTPMIFSHDGSDELIVLGSRRLTAYDPVTGQERWWLGGFPEETVGVPVAGDGLLFASAAALGGRGDDYLDAAATWKMTVEEFDRDRDNQIQRDEMTSGFAFIQRPELPRDNPGYGLPVRDMDVLLQIFDHDKDGLISEAEWMQTMAGFAAHSQPYLAALRPGATRNARPSHLAWEIRRGIPETPSLLHCQGKLYLVRDGGVLTCLEAATGKELFRERIGAPGQYIASPVAAGDQLVVASVPGIVTVLALADELQILARNEFRESIFATPAVAGNRLYLRTAAHLYAVGD